MISEYLEYFDESMRPEDIMMLGDMVKALLTCRKVLSTLTRPAAENSSYLMLKVVKNIKNQLQNGFLSTNVGQEELNIYLTVTTVHSRLIDMLTQSVINCGRLTGHLDAVKQTPENSRTSAVRLSEAIPKCEHFIQLCGPTLSLGLAVEVEEASLLLKLRNAVTSGNWPAVSLLLSQNGESNTSAKRPLSPLSSFIKQEIDFITQAQKFHEFDSKLSLFVSNFDINLIGKRHFETLKIDFSTAKSLFNEFVTFLDISSTLLSDRSCPISDSFFGKIHFLSFKALLRLLTAAIEKKLFYDKKKLHSNAEQLVSRNMDRFLFEFFGLTDAEYCGSDCVFMDHLADGRKRYSWFM